MYSYNLFFSYPYAVTIKLVFHLPGLDFLSTHAYYDNFFDPGWSPNDANKVEINSTFSIHVSIEIFITFFSSKRSKPIQDKWKWKSLKSGLVIWDTFFKWGWALHTLNVEIISKDTRRPICSDTSGYLKSIHHQTPGKLFLNLSLSWNNSIT